MSATAGWSLRFKRPAEHPFIGKFSSKINFDDAIHPIHMSLQEEQLKEEVNDDEIIKDAEYYKKKKQKKRRKYSKQSKLVIEDSSHAISGSSIGIGRFEGQLVDLSLNEAAYPSQMSKGENQDGSFRYALLEVVAASTTESKQTEVNVIPIHDMFYFRRPALTGDKLLDEIDDAYDEKIRKDKLKMQRYRRIGKALDEIEARDNNPDASNPDADDMGASSQSKSFDIPALFGSITKKSKGRGGGGGGGRKATEASNSGLVDEDQVRELGYEYTGDYRVQFVDDEEDNVIQEQNFLNAVEEDYTAQRDAVVNVDMEGAYENESEEEEEDDESDTPPAGVVVTAPSTSIAGINEEDFDRSARIARELLLQNSKKRTRDLTTNTSANLTQVKPSTLQDISSDQPKTLPKAVSSSNISDIEPKATDSEKYEFSESGLIAFMQAMGGRATTAAVKEAFKSQLKVEGKRLGKKELAQSKFLDIIKAVAEVDGDGVLILKSF